MSRFTNLQTKTKKVEDSSRWGKVDVNTAIKCLHYFTDEYIYFQSDQELLRAPIRHIRDYRDNQKIDSDMWADFYYYGTCCPSSGAVLYVISMASLYCISPQKSNIITMSGDYLQRYSVAPKKLERFSGVI